MHTHGFAELAFLSGGAGPLELLLLFLVVLVLFGPKRLPEIARTIGRVLEDLRRSSRDFRDQVMDIDARTPHDGPDAPVGYPDEGGVIELDTTETDSSEPEAASPDADRRPGADGPINEEPGDIPDDEENGGHSDLAG